MSFNLRRWDTILISLGVLAFLGSVFWSAAGSDGDLVVQVEAGGREYLMPLSGDGFLDINGPVGVTRVNVFRGTAYISYSDCKNKIGIKMGKISTASGWLACLPNGVFVRLVPGAGESISGVDASTF